MRENNVGRQSDRSYLCLVTIYAIHAILLNVVYVVDSGNRGLTMSIMKNLSDSSVMMIDDENFPNNIVTSTNRTDTTADYVGRRKIVVTANEADDSVKSSRNAFLQSKSGEASIHFLAAAKISSVSRLMKNAMDTARTIVERLSPAALGIICGCLVFLLTFTEHDYV